MQKQISFQIQKNRPLKSKQESSKTGKRFEKSKELSSSVSKRGRPRIRPLHSFGGSYFRNYNPREARPIFSQKALHLVLRSSLAQGKYSMRQPQHEKRIWEIIKKHAGLNGVTIYEFANAGSHLHLLIRVKRQDFYRRFIRSITGLIARAVRSCERGQPLKRKFWDARPFSRVVQFAGTEFKKVKLYFARNRFEALGFINYLPRISKATQEWKLFWIHYVCLQI